MQTRRSFIQASTLAALGATLVPGAVAAPESNQRIVLASRPVGKPT